MYRLSFSTSSGHLVAAARPGDRREEDLEERLAADHQLHPVQRSGDARQAAAERAQQGEQQPTQEVPPQHLPRSAISVVRVARQGEYRFE